MRCLLDHGAKMEENEHGMTPLKVRSLFQNFDPPKSDITKHPGCRRAVSGCHGGLFDREARGQQVEISATFYNCHQNGKKCKKYHKNVKGWKFLQND